MPESITEAVDLPDPDDRFTEADLALVDALQTAPRAPWTRIGRALGVDATTAARRWERLCARRLAWITAYESGKATVVAFVEVRCRAGTMESVTAELTELPWVISVDETAGDFDLFVSVAAADLPALGRAVHRDIGGLPGVRSTRTRLGITAYGEGSDWRIRAMEPAGHAQLSQGRASRHLTYSSELGRRPAPEDLSLIRELGTDGRLGHTELAAATGLSEHTARRRLTRLIQAGDLTFRCDLAHPLAGLPTMMIYRTVVPHTRLEQTGLLLARMEQVRLCVSVSGPHNLLVLVWLHGLFDIGPFETTLAQRCPELEVKDRTVALRSLKRMGWLLDLHGRAVRRVPLGPPQK
ncbi:Lrp/AsnC family transcriptional regulator [Streptomyces sp. Ncost-T10-10d]|uniref:Lrp/AsnC family transcriptional regulator n=1 Tax=Streptomyces sp. Ncost-T10-10d TaxID=1839774 RepID=UPI00081D7C4C|nr:Lrp/AsnC family transcriptional regulator [Streptomyces sp. Ncost-T10-10d]SCF56743.1 DNA-binding transcriptional regulator, Lrp family [Streptomyces sp. Ncost-T10-10d]